MSQNKGGSNDFAYFFILAIIFGLAWAIWHYGKEPILNVMRWLRYGELWVVHLFSNTIYLTDKPTRIDQLLSVLVQATPQQLNWPFLAAIEKALMQQFYRWPIILALAGAIYWSMFRSPETLMRTVYSLDTFIERQALTWPVISPIIKFNPLLERQRVSGSVLPAKLPPFSEALSPEEWLGFNKIPIAGDQIDTSAAAQALMPQLGPRWQGFVNNPPYVLGLIAAFALKGARKRAAADDFLGELAECWDIKGGFRINMKLRNRISNILKDPKVGPPALEVMNKHFYRTPALIRLLLWARERGGVLAPATFVWLRAHDRDLWYPLNNVGRRTFHAEASGAMAHYFAEVGLGRPLPMPKLDAAINSLNVYLAENTPKIPEIEDSKKVGNKNILSLPKKK